MSNAKRSFARWASYTFGIGAVPALALAYLANGETSADRSSYRTAAIERGTIASTVSASGALKALVTVDVGTQISGQIKFLLADFNSEVRAGAIIARLDPAAYEARVTEAEADLANARAQVAMMEARLEGIRADTRQALSALGQAKLDGERKRALLPAKAIAQAQFDAAVAAHEQADARVQGMRAKEAEQRAQIELAKAVVRQKEAILKQRRIDFANTEIRSPVDGVVIARNVQVGQTVAASLQSPVLFTIAQDLKRMQVEVNVDEADIGRIREGLSASFTVDSLPGHTYAGTVRQVRKAPKEVSSVVSYTVVVSAENPDLLLLPGMTANVTFVIDRREDAALVPNAALRFRPQDARSDSADAADKPRSPARTQLAVVQQNGGGDPERDSNTDRRALAGPAAVPGTVYLLGADGEPRAINIRVGVSDGTRTEVLAGDVRPGDRVVVAGDKGTARNSPTSSLRFGL
jgi:HlyD family secretion protein